MTALEISAGQVGDMAIASVVQRLPGGFAQPVWSIRIPGAHVSEALIVAMAYLPWIEVSFLRVGRA